MFDSDSWWWLCFSHTTPAGASTDAGTDAGSDIECLCASLLR